MAGDGRTALVAGATGLVGGQLVGLLRDSGRYARVVALVRRPLSGVDGVESRVTDFSSPGGALQDAAGADVFCCLGTTLARAGSREAFREVDHGHVTRLARAAREAGAAQWLSVSAMGASSSSGVFYNRVKGEADDVVTASGIPHVAIFRPSLLLGERAEHRPGEKAAVLLAPLFTPLMVGPLKRYRPILARDVARAMAAVAARGGAGVRVFDSDEVQALADGS